MQEQLRDSHRRKINAQQVPGWGIDADPENDPTFPMKVHVEGEHDPYTGHRPTRPDQQSDNVEILHSNERPNLAAVFGTPLPPSGLSGMIRRAAFNYSENSYGHWLPLMLADRVQMIEGVVDDLAHGHIPNVFSEAGWKADWKYNRKAVVTKVAVGTALAVGIYALIRSRRSRSDSDERSDDRNMSNQSGEGRSVTGADRGTVSAVRSDQKAEMKDRMGSLAGASTGSIGSQKSDRSRSAQAATGGSAASGLEGGGAMGGSQSTGSTGSSQSSAKMGSTQDKMRADSSQHSGSSDDRSGDASSKKSPSAAKTKNNRDDAGAHRGI